MDDIEDDQVTRRPEQPDYSKKDFKRAAEDLHSCLQEALDFFPKFDAEFTNETKEIKKYGDVELLNIIGEKKVLRLENGPRLTASGSDNNPWGGRQSNLGNYCQDPSGSSSSNSTSGAGIKSLQHRITVTVEAMLDCKSPEPIDDDEGPQIRIEEIRDFEDRMRKTAVRLYNSLSSISYDVQAFRRVIRDLTTMSQDLNLFPLKLWKGDGGQKAEYDQH
jgi:hypothetical protein